MWSKTTQKYNDFTSNVGRYNTVQHNCDSPETMDAFLSQRVQPTAKTNSVQRGTDFFRSASKFVFLFAESETISESEKVSEKMHQALKIYDKEITNNSFTRHAEDDAFLKAVVLSFEAMEVTLAYLFRDSF